MQCGAAAEQLPAIEAHLPSDVTKWPYGFNCRQPLKRFIKSELLSLQSNFCISTEATPRGGLVLLNAPMHFQEVCSLSTLPQIIFS